MIDQHGKLRRAAGLLIRLYAEVSACPTCNAVSCHKEVLDAAFKRVRDDIRETMELRRAIASLLWYLRDVKECPACYPEEGCHRRAFEAAVEAVREELQKGGRRT